MTNKVIFPIRSETSCLLKWAWSTVYFNSGTSASCHRTKKLQIDPNNFASFHNLPDKITAREKMIQGQWPGDGCEYCKNIEDGGGLSDRKLHDELISDAKLIPPELQTDTNAVNVTPTILEVYFTNTCNMSCVYCGPHFSSKWEDENRKHGNIFQDLIKNKFSILQPQENPNYEKMVKGLWDYLKEGNRAAAIQRFHVLGGEPFLLKELDQTIAFWARYGHPDLQISLISNLNIPHDRFKNYIKKFELLVKKNKMWRLQLTASLDGWASDQEYTRFGLDLSLWEKNFEYILNTPWICPSINSAITALTIKGLPALVKKINEWNQKQEDVVEEFRTYPNPVLHSFNTTNTFDSPYIFPGSVFLKEFNQVLELMPEETETQRGQKVLMQGIADMSQQQTGDPEKIIALKGYLDQLDARRNTNWRSTFPWLANLP